MLSGLLPLVLGLVLLFAGVAAFCFLPLTIGAPLGVILIIAACIIMAAGWLRSP